MPVLCRFDHRNITFRDLCAAGRLTVPGVQELQRIADGAIPCLILTPIDCFWEGSILQEPDTPVAPVNISTCQSPSPSGLDENGMPANVTWGNLNFPVLTDCLTAYPPSGYTPFVDLVRILHVE